jgi:transcriptional regulator with XRE-family HTH domain
MNIRTDLKQKIKQAGMTAADVSRGIGINYEMLNRYLNGRANMPKSIEDQINVFLG